MESIPLDQIIVPDNRIRREFGDKKLADLAASIEDKGLLHPVVVHDDGKTLACGERRLRAVALLYTTKGIGIYCDGKGIPPGSIPTTRMQDLDPYRLREAELEENVCRQDLTVQEYSLTISELHKLRIEQHGEYDRTTGKGWSKASTSEEVKGRKIKAGIKEINYALLIAENLDDPFVAAAGSRAEALRAVRDRKKLEGRQSKTRSFDATKTEHRLILGDAFNYVYLGKDTNFDVILTDPPYGMELHKTTMFDDNVHDYDDSNEMFQKICSELPDLAMTITAKQAHCFVFCDIRRFNEMFIAFELAGWTCWQRPLIWHKGNIGSFGAGEFGFRQTYDAILFANKGRRPLNSVYDEVIRVNQPTNHAHPAGKPAELFSEILRRCSSPGDRVLDLFCGSGPIFPAAQKNKCIATGIELNEKYHQMSMETIMEMKK